MKPPRFPWIKAILFAPCAMTLTASALGVFFIPLPFLWFFSIPLLLGGAWPYAHWMSKSINAKVAYEFRDKPLVEGTPEWEQAPVIDEDELIAIVIHGSGRGRNGN